METCPECGEKIEIGTWPWCPHLRPRKYIPFKGWLDDTISYKPVYIDSLAKWNKEMKRNNVEYKGFMSKGDISASNDKARDVREERKHAH